MPEELARSFEEAAGFALPPRRVNTLELRLARADDAFGLLARVLHREPARGLALQRRVPGWLRRWPGREEAWALAGYVAYCRGRYAAAERAFYRAVALEPRNLDNWLDLGLTLRHMGEHSLAQSVLLDHASFISAYLSSPPKRFNRPSLRALARRRVAGDVRSWLPR